jgi:putative tryptophan/tyrosine transport system substrate-binding protein
MWRKIAWLIAALTLSIFLAPVAAREGWALNPGKVYRVGVVVVLPPNLLPPNAPLPPPLTPAGRAFVDRLADHGYIEGKNLVIERRFGGYERLAELAAELVRLQVDVIRIVSDAVKETPLVIHSCDAFEHVARLARPEGNLTGVTCMSTELSPKRLDLLKEAVPAAVRVVFLSDPAGCSSATAFKAVLRSESPQVCRRSAPCTSVTWSLIPRRGAASCVSLSPVGASSGRSG